MGNCPRCQGSGKCVECEGSGKVTCPNCEGKGECVTPRGMTYPCKACHGSGQVECSTECVSCKGTGEITEKLQKAQREKYSVRFDNFSPLARVTMWLAAINCVVYVIQNAGPMAFEQALWNDQRMMTQHQYWRILTPVILHNGLWHLAFNCWFLVSYCPAIEGVYGTRRFLLLYLVGAAFGNLFSYFGHVYLEHEPYYASVGASTALFAVGAAYLGLHWRWGFFDQPTIRTWSFYLAGYLLIGFTGWGFFGSIDNWGHLGGTIGGLAYVYLSGRPTGH
jgi:membrane associated rhomboid family serine protease